MRSDAVAPGWLTFSLLDRGLCEYLYNRSQQRAQGASVHVEINRPAVVRLGSTGRRPGDRGDRPARRPAWLTQDDAVQDVEHLGPDLFGDGGGRADGRPGCRNASGNWSVVAFSSTMTVDQVLVSRVAGSRSTCSQRARTTSSLPGSSSSPAMMFQVIEMPGRQRDGLLLPAAADHQRDVFAVARIRHRLVGPVVLPVTVGRSPASIGRMMSSASVSLSNAR